MEERGAAGSHHLIVDEVPIQRGGLWDGLEEDRVLLGQCFLACEPPCCIFLPPLLEPLLDLLLLPRHIPVVEGHLCAAQHRIMKLRPCAFLCQVPQIF